MIVALSIHSSNSVREWSSQDQRSSLHFYSLHNNFEVFWLLRAWEFMYAFPSTWCGTSFCSRWTSKDSAKFVSVLRWSVNKEWERISTASHRWSISREGTLSFFSLSLSLFIGSPSLCSQPFYNLVDCHKPSKGRVWISMETPDFWSQRNLSHCSRRKQTFWNQIFCSSLWRWCLAHIHSSLILLLLLLLSSSFFDCYFKFCSYWSSTRGKSKKYSLQTSSDVASEP